MPKYANVDNLLPTKGTLTTMNTTASITTKNNDDNNHTNLFYKFIPPCWIEGRVPISRNTGPQSLSLERRLYVLDLEPYLCDHFEVAYLELEYDKHDNFGDHDVSKKSTVFFMTEAEDHSMLLHRQGKAAQMLVPLICQKISTRQEGSGSFGAMTATLEALRSENG